METKNKLRWVLLILALVIAIAQLLRIDFEHFEWLSLLGPISMALVILAMIISIRQSKK